jgi:hypothetical protein
MMGEPLTLPHVGPEERQLCAILARGLRPSGHAPLPDGAVDWPRFLRLADRHRVAAIAFRLLTPDDTARLPGAVIAGLKQRHDLNAIASLRLASVLVEVFRTFGQAGIPVLSLKGAGLALQAYGDLAARHAGDLDILVSPDDLLAADATLRASGWARVSNVDHAPIVAPLLTRPRLDRKSVV